VRVRAGTGNRESGERGKRKRDPDCGKLGMLVNSFLVISGDAFEFLVSSNPRS